MPPDHKYGNEDAERRQKAQKTLVYGLVDEEVVCVVRLFWEQRLPAEWPGWWSALQEVRIPEQVGPVADKRTQPAEAQTVELRPGTVPYQSPRPFPDLGAASQRPAQYLA